MGELFTPAHFILIALLAVPVFGVHFVPVIIAGFRHARNFWWIVVVTVFLGWTLIGWVAALIWALQDEPRFAGGVWMPPPPAPPYNR